MTTLKQLRENDSTHEVTFHKQSSLGGSQYNTSKLKVKANDETHARTLVHQKIAHIYPDYRITKVNALHEATFATTNVTDKPLNPKLAKTASQEYKSKAKKGVHKAQPVTMFDAGHVAGHPVGESVDESTATRPYVVFNKQTKKVVKSGFPDISRASTWMVKNKVDKNHVVTHHTHLDKLMNESRGHSIIARKLKTMEFLKQGFKKQYADKPEEPAEKPKDQFTPPEKK